MEAKLPIGGLTLGKSSPQRRIAGPVIARLASSRPHCVARIWCVACIWQRAGVLMGEPRRSRRRQNHARPKPTLVALAFIRNRCMSVACDLHLAETMHDRRRRGTQQIAGFCGLCIARCGTIATVEAGRFTRLNPDQAIPPVRPFAPKAAPHLTACLQQGSLDATLAPSATKGHPDPGWEEISRDLALTETVAAMRRIADQFGPEAVAFSQCSPSTTAIGDASSFVRRLMHAFGTPNQVSSLDLCGWGRGYATRYAFGVGSVGTGSAGGAMPDIERSGCLLLWGYNPSHSRLTHATATVACAKARLETDRGRPAQRRPRQRRPTSGYACARARTGRWPCKDWPIS